MVADDFVYALERVLDPKSGAGTADFYMSIAGAKDFAAGKADHVSGLRAVDERHLEIELERADSIFPMLMALDLAAPMKRSWVAKVKGHLTEQPLASGPFYLESWNRGTRLVLRRNPHYWNPAVPLLDEIDISLLVPRDVAVLKFLSGEIDTLDRLAADDYIRFASTPEWQPYLIATKSLGVFGELLNVRKKPFDDVRVRQAMNYAYNKEDTIRLYNGRATVAHGIIPQAMPAYDPNLPDYPYDPEKARALLAEAGYPNGFTVTYSLTNDEIYLRIAQAMQADYAKVGIKMNIEILTFPAYLTETGKGELWFAYSGWTVDFPDPWDFLHNRFGTAAITPENANNDSGYSNPEFDALVENARYEVDPEKRLAMYRKAERIVHDDCPWVWHYYPIQVEIVQPYVKGYKPHPIWLRDFRHMWLDLPRVKR
jgi:ABC-type transport system substrate-binding protein